MSSILMRLSLLQSFFHQSQYDVCGWSRVTRFDYFRYDFFFCFIKTSEFSTTNVIAFHIVLFRLGLIMINSFSPRHLIEFLILQGFYSSLRGLIQLVHYPLCLQLILDDAGAFPYVSTSHYPWSGVISLERVTQYQLPLQWFYPSYAGFQKNTCTKITYCNGTLSYHR